MSQLRYYFKKRTAISPTEKAIKNSFQKLYQANDYAIFDTLWQNEGLRGTLFPEKSEAQAKADFVISSTNLDSNLYSFIDVK